MLKGYRLIGLYLLCVIALIIWLCSCKSTEYVPLVEHQTELVHIHDTVRQSDSVKTEINTIIREARPEDSAMIAKLGIKLQGNERLLLLLQRELSDTKKELKESHSRDSVRADTVQVPVPVERKLSKWEQVCLDYGKLMMGGTVVAVILCVVLIVRWIRRIRNDI